LFLPARDGKIPDAGTYNCIYLYVKLPWKFSPTLRFIS